jgi:hypothetical protein
MASENQFAQMLEVLGWSDTRAAFSLEVDAARVAQWRSGARTTPSATLKRLQAIVDIHTGGETSSAEWERTTSNNYRNTVDNPHDNWHGDDVHRAQAEAEQRERDLRERELEAERARTRAHAADRGAIPEEPAPEAADPSPEISLSEGERDLVARLVALRESYKELAGAYTELRALYQRQTGAAPPPLYGAHDVLGVAPDATWDEIREAYKARSRDNHPDRGGDLDEMQTLSAAYAELKVLFGR